MAASVVVERRGAVGEITLNRPDRLNAFNDEMHDRFAGALRDLAEDAGCRAVVLTGAGRGFCAGQDLADRVRGSGAEPPDLGATLERFYNPHIRRIAGMPKPVICAVNGVAAGAGASLALACDLVVAARSSKFIQAFIKVGLLPDSGATYFLPRQIGVARATALMMLAIPVPAEQAAAWGMIWTVVDDDHLPTATSEMADYLASQPTEGLALMKQALRASFANTLDAQLNLERDLQRLAGRTHDYAEGVEAFFAKRPPVFAGRTA